MEPPSREARTRNPHGFGRCRMTAESAHRGVRDCTYRVAALAPGWERSPLGSSHFWTRVRAWKMVHVSKRSQPKERDQPQHSDVNPISPGRLITMTFWKQDTLDHYTTMSGQRWCPEPSPVPGFKSQRLTVVLDFFSFWWHIGSPLLKASATFSTMKDTLQVAGVYFSAVISSSPCRVRS